MREIRIKILEDSHFIVRRLMSKNINIYNIEYRSDGNIYTIDESDLDKIPFEVEVLSYKGIKGFLFLIRKNIHYLIALLISIALMFTLSNMIFDIEIIHTDKHLRNTILESLTLNDVHPFMFKLSFKEKERIKNKIKESHKDEIEWLEIIDNGMKYTIRVEERIITKYENSPDYCDIVSKKDALVLDGTVIKGERVALEGDYVKKNSVLISGAIKFNDEIKNYVCASGTIYGNTWYTVNVSIPYEYEIKDYTGKTHTNYSFLLGSKKTKIFKTHLDKYDTRSKEILTLGNLTIYKDIEREYVGKNKKYTKEEINNLAISTARKKLLTNLDEKTTILYEKVLHSTEFDSIIEMEIFYSVSEPIGVPKEMSREGV